MRGGHVSDEDLAKSACSGVAIEDKVQIVLSHCAGPPVGPNRSVLIAIASCPSSTRKLETSSTKGVAYIFGFRSVESTRRPASTCQSFADSPSIPPAVFW